MTRTILAALLLIGATHICQADEPANRTRLRPAPSVQVARLVDAITSSSDARRSQVRVYTEGNGPAAPTGMTPQTNAPWYASGPVGHSYLHNCQCTNEPYTHGLWDTYCAERKQHWSHPRKFLYFITNGFQSKDCCEPCQHQHH